jgi:glycosyltransferase involved in cell wall biosynthesis
MDVRFVGKRSRSETLTWLGAADEIVHASRAEGLSTVVREAEHLGVPVTILS